VWSKDQGIKVIMLADIHLSLKPPIWRSSEEDWFAAMQRPLDEIRKLQDKYDCPIICAGDVFDKWNSSPELINFAVEYLPTMYAIPGQHDLPLHNYHDINKSAYMSLVHTGNIQNVLPNRSVLVENDIVLHGFPFGYPIKPITQVHLSNKFNIAIVHEYKWIKGFSYTNAPTENMVHLQGKDMIENKWKGYDAVIYGDNHIGFKCNLGSTQIFNCGSLMRRHSDQVNYKPKIGILTDDNSILPYYLDTKDDLCLKEMSSDNCKILLDMKGFIKELEKLESTDLDFTEAVKMYMEKNKVKAEVFEVIMKAMESL